MSRATALKEKSPQAFRTISEVAETIDVPAHVLRFWEGKFTQIKPVKRGGGRRYYRPSDVALLMAIRDLLYRDGLTIRGAQKVLREKGIRTLSAPYLDGADGTADQAAEAIEPTNSGPDRAEQQRALREALKKLEDLRERMLQ